jgi:hypothetical protein
LADFTKPTGKVAVRNISTETNGKLWQIERGKRMTELIKEPDLQTFEATRDERFGDPSDGGRSLCAEVDKVHKQLELLTSQVADLCKATRSLCQLMSVLDRAVRVKMEGTGSADCAVL